jgi:hypothetical protein
MTKVVIEQMCDTDVALYSDGYDTVSTLVGQYILARSGPNPEDNNVGPLTSSVFRPYEISTAAQSMGIMDVVDLGNGTFWIFSGDSGTDNRIHLTVYTGGLIDPLNNGDRYTKEEFNYKGYVSFTTPTTSTFTGLRAVRTLYTNGTVGVNATTGVVTGSSTLFNGTGGATPAAGGAGVGARIGFGSSDPNAITTWYEIASISSDTSLNLVSTTLPATVLSGSEYVIEEIRIYFTSVCNTATDGGLRVIKGLNFMDFDPRQRHFLRERLFGLFGSSFQSPLIFAERAQ